VLFLGGAGMIGSAVTAEALAQGIDVTIATRSEPSRSVPDDVAQIRVDVRDADALRVALKGRSFDTVVNWVGFSPADVDGHAELFATVCGQYTFVSTGSVYARPVAQLPITESSPLGQPRFDYGAGKIACERTLTDDCQSRGLPLTIVRPFHTYDKTVVPFPASWTVIERMRARKPVVVHGDGTSLWTLMHSEDLARALVPLLGNLHALGETVNLVSGEILCWDQIYLALARAAGVRGPDLVHRSSETIARELPSWKDVLLEDFRHSMLFDTTKLRTLVPGFVPRWTFSRGAEALVAYHDANSNERTIDRDLDRAYDSLAVTR